MKKRFVHFAILISMALASSLVSVPAFADDILVKSCSELVRIAENYQRDLKTVDTVLGSAIDAGNIDRIKNYKLKKAVIKQQLDGAMRAIEVKGCAKTR